MITLSTKIRPVLLAVAAIGVGLFCLIEFTDWPQLEAVTLNGQAVDNWESRLGLDAQASVLKQPLAEDEQTARVDIGYGLPATLYIETNRFRPVALVLDRVSRRLVGLNRLGRVVPLSRDHDNWELPVVVGVEARHVFDLCSDARVPRLMAQLERLADENLDFFRLLDEIDLSEADRVTVTISGLPYRLRVGAPDFCEQIDRFISFIEQYQPDLDSTSAIDLRFANLIIRTSERN